MFFLLMFMCFFFLLFFIIHFKKNNFIHKHFIPIFHFYHHPPNLNIHFIHLAWCFPYLFDNVFFSLLGFTLNLWLIRDAILFFFSFCLKLILYQLFIYSNKHVSNIKLFIEKINSSISFFPQCKTIHNPLNPC
jgi:hypothetical protein